MKKYTKKYFIEKFSKISDNEIGSGSIDKHCAIWHCGLNDYVENPSEEVIALISLFNNGITHYKYFNENNEELSFPEYSAIYKVNDMGLDEETPKQRLLNKLKSL